MNYSLVRQFANNSIDNFFNFFYKWVDFFKVLLELILAFADIWVTFFQIFSNAYLYVYYLLLFGIDKSTQSSTGFTFWRRLPKRVAYSPSKVYVKDIHNPVPGMYSKQAGAATVKLAKATVSGGQAVKETVSATVQKFGNRPRGVKTDRLKKIMEFFAELFKSIKNFITAPVRSVAEFIVRKMRPVREEEPGGNKSLIDEYMREYEQRRRA
jgi:hypothetical protein